MRHERILVPWVWWFEVQNLLVANERRGRLGADHTERILDAMRRLPVERDASPEEGVTLALARRHGLSIYAAAYLELARREGAALATMDARLSDATVAEDVPLLTQ
jgi:predicted nucleic acid-binding protein